MQYKNGAYGTIRRAYESTKQRGWSGQPDISNKGDQELETKRK